MDPSISSFLKWLNSETLDVPSTVHSARIFQAVYFVTRSNLRLERLESVASSGVNLPTDKFGDFC